MVPPSDDDLSLRLVKLIQAGINPDENFRQLHKLHYSQIFYFFLHKRFSWDEANDLTQDVLMRVYTGIKDFRSESSFKTWLFRIMLSVWKNELRRRGAERRKGMEVLLDAHPEEGGGAPQIPSEEPNPLDNTLQHEERRKLSEAVEQLPPQMRQCFLLRYRHGFKYRQIAGLMNISIETVKAHIHQAKKKLQIALSADSEE